MRLSHRDYDLLLSLIRSVLDCADFDSFPDVSLAALRRAVRADRYSYNELDARTHMARMRVVPKASGEENLREHFYQLFPTHPIIADSIRTGAESTRKVSDFLSLRQFRNTPIHTDYYRHLSINYQLSSFILNRQGVLIGFACNRNTRDFTSRDKCILDLLRPCLRKLYFKLRRENETRQAAEVLARATRASGLGVISLTGNCMVNWMTRHACLLLEKHHACEPWNHKQLPASLHKWVKDQAHAHSTGRIQPATLVKSLADGTRLQIHFFASDEGQAWLTLTEWSQSLPEAALCSAGLTSREGETLKWLVAGKSNPEIGVILGISPRTVEKHLERIFPKLGVENRLAAVQMANAWRVSSASIS